MYRAYDVKIRKEDRKKADEILWKHWMATKATYPT